jgi:hypothetical protein
MRDVAQTASSRFPVYVSKAVSQDGFFVAVICVMSFATKSINPFVPRARHSYLASSSASSTIAPLATFSGTKSTFCRIKGDSSPSVFTPAILACFPVVDVFERVEPVLEQVENLGPLPVGYMGDFRPPSRGGEARVNGTETKRFIN